MYRTALIIAAAAGLAACATTARQAPAAPARAPDATHYSYDATFAPGHETIEAVARVTLPANIANAGPGFLLGRRFEVEVAADVPASIAIEAAERPVPELNIITITLDEPTDKPVTLTFSYRGPLNQQWEGAYVAAREDQIELRLDMMWLPIFRDINLQFSLDARLRGVPEDFTALTQGAYQRTGDVISIRREMIDIDFPFVAARGLSKVSGPGVEIFAADFDWIVTDMMRRHAIGSAAFFQDWFGPLPDGKVRVAILPQGSGGYARRGYIVTGEAREEVERTGEVPEWGPARHISHEFAHAWWSPADTLTEHRWLSESIAEFMALRYVEHAFGLIAAHAMLERKRPRAEAARPVLGAGGPSGDSMYQRGSFLLFDLEEKIGRTKLDEVFRRLAAKPPSLTEEFMAMLAAVAGDEAVAYFDGTMRSGPGPWKQPAAGDTAAAP